MADTPREHGTGIAAEASITRTASDAVAAADQPTAPQKSAPARRRADASHNRARILDAAEAVFVETGINTHLDVVAERAGVGRATLFRNFPDRHTLIVSLLERGLEELEREAARTGADPGALRHLLCHVAERMIAQSPLSEYWQTFAHDSPEFQSTRRRLIACFEQAVASAVAAGTCRKDLAPSDVLLLIAMMGGALYARTPGARRHLSGRAWTFVIEMAQLKPPAPGGDQEKGKQAASQDAH